MVIQLKFITFVFMVIILIALSAGLCVYGFFKIIANAINPPVHYSPEKYTPPENTNPYIVEHLEVIEKAMEEDRIYEDYKKWAKQEMQPIVFSKKEFYIKTEVSEDFIYNKRHNTAFHKTLFSEN